DARLCGYGDLAAHIVEIPGQAGHVTWRARTRRRDTAQGRSDGVHPRRKRRICLVSEPVIVLDVIDPTLREVLGELRERFRRQALWLECRAGQRPGRRSRPAPQSMDAMTRTAERLAELGRQFHVVQHDIL